MTQISIDNQTYQRAVELAARGHSTVEQVIADAIRWMALEGPGSVIGALSEDASFLDEVVEGAMGERESRPLRAPDA